MFRTRHSQSPARQKVARSYWRARDGQELNVKPGDELAMDIVDGSWAYGSKGSNRCGIGNYGNLDEIIDLESV